MTDANGLLGTLDSLSHRGRLARAASVAQELARTGGGALGALLDELSEAPEYYPRMIAAVMADAAYDVPRLRRACADRSRLVRRLAAASLVRRDHDAVSLAAWYLTADAATRRCARRHLLAQRRGDVAELLVEPLLAQRNVRDARALLPLCTEATVARVLAVIDAPLVRWSGLAVRLPSLAARTLAGALAGASGDSARGWAWTPHATSTALVLSQRDPDALLDLLERHAGPTPPASLTRALANVARRRPERFGAWLLDDARVPSLTRLVQGLPKGALRALPHGVLAQVLRKNLRYLQPFVRTLQALAPSVRGQVFEAAIAGEETARTRWPSELLEVLPWRVRQREADRMAGLREVRESAHVAAEIAGFLPVEEARARLVPLSRGSAAEDRAVGNAGLVQSARRARRGVSAVVEEMAARLANEQDPVRLATLRALAEVPGGAFVEADAPHVLALVTSVVEARDTSAETRRLCGTLAQQLLRAHAHAPTGVLFRTGLAVLQKLAGHAGVFDLPAEVFKGMRRSAVAPLVEALLPWLQQNMERSYFSGAIRVAAHLGERAWPLLALQRLLEEAIWSTPTHGWTAAPLWLADPKTRDERVRAALAKDRSMVALPSVWGHLHRVRQDLLDPYVTGPVLGGRFASSSAGWVFPAVDGFHRWLPRQQRALARVLYRVGLDTGHQTTERASAVKSLARMPVHGPEDLAMIVRSDEVPIAEAALGALVWTDRPDEALGVLLDNIDGDRARVAMYAVPRVAQFIGGETMLARMTELLARPKLKVTVQKEALRLIGGVGGELAAKAVGDVWARPKAHRDVRIAALHASRALLDYPSSWALLEAATKEPEIYAAKALIEAQPVGIPAEHRERYARVLLELASHPDGRVRAMYYTALNRPAYGVGDWLEIVRDGVQRAAAEAVLDTRDTFVWAAAVDVLVELLVRRPQSPEPVTRALLGLAELVASERANPEPGDERDLPATQRLMRLVYTLTAQPWHRRAVIREAFPTLERALPGTAFVRQRAQLRLAGVRPDEAALGPVIEGLLAEPSSSALASWVEQRCVAAVGDVTTSGDASRHLPVVLALAGSTSAAARGVAVRALGILGSVVQWPPAWRDALVRLRRDTDEGVRTLACETFTIAE